MSWNKLLSVCQTRPPDGTQLLSVSFLPGGLSPSKAYCGLGSEQCLCRSHSATADDCADRNCSDGCELSKCNYQGNFGSLLNGALSSHLELLLRCCQQLSFDRMQRALRKYERKLSPKHTKASMNEPRPGSCLAADRTGQLVTIECPVESPNNTHNLHVPPPTSDRQIASGSLPTQSRSPDLPDPQTCRNYIDISFTMQLYTTGKEVQIPSCSARRIYETQSYAYLFSNSLRCAAGSPYNVIPITTKTKDLTRQYLDATLQRVPHSTRPRTCEWSHTVATATCISDSTKLSAHNLMNDSPFYHARCCHCVTD